MTARPYTPRRYWLRIGVAALLLGACDRGVLAPQGPVGAAEKTLLLNATGIMLAIVLPVMLATLGVAWWFRAGNARARYRPTFTYSGKVEIVIWSIPAMVILLLGGITWISCHDLDPARPLASTRPTTEVQVVSLDWKWLFLYPRQGIATVNRLVVPAGAPVRLTLTSATVMNSFFIPQLGSQIYTMTGMTTQLNLLADHPGRFQGLAAQFSGDGFSDMRFQVEAVPQAAFDAWVATARQGGETLDAGSYAALARPSSKVAPRLYAKIDPMLFDRIVAGNPAAASPTPRPHSAMLHGDHNKGL